MSKYTEDQYPVVVYKQAPLIVRVDDLILVVGSSSFSAKITIGTMSLLLPISSPKKSQKILRKIKPHRKALLALIHRYY